MQTKTDTVARAATGRKILSTAAPASNSPSRKAAGQIKEEATASPPDGADAVSPLKPGDASPTAAPDAPVEAPATPQATVQTPVPVWTDEDENALQAMMARRKAAGFQRRGRDTGGQLLAAGAIVPNPGTVVAIIVGLVAECGPMVRDELVAAMASAPFPHAKARPADRAWCQGYVAGALRDGFLALAGEGSPAEKIVESGG